MDKLSSFVECDDGSCCCFQIHDQRKSIIVISILNMAVCITDLILAEACVNPCCLMRDYVETGRMVLVTLFQVANTLLLGGVIFESAFLVQLYLWYTLVFVLLGLVITILEFLCRFEDEYVSSLVSFLPEVAFLFVLYRCLPIIDTYRQYLIDKY